MRKNVLTIQAAAEILGVSPQTLRNWDKSGKLKAVRDLESGYRRYSIPQLEKFAQKNKLKRPSNGVKLVL